MAHELRGLGYLAEEWSSAPSRFDGSQLLVTPAPGALVLSDLHWHMYTQTEILIHITKHKIIFIGKEPIL